MYLSASSPPLRSCLQTCLSWQQLRDLQVIISGTAGWNICEIPVFIYVYKCVKHDMQRRVFIWSIYKYCVCVNVHINMYIKIQGTHTMQIKTVYMWLHYNTPPMTTQAPNQNVHKQRRRHTCTASMLQNASLATVQLLNQTKYHIKWAKNSSNIFLPNKIPKIFKFLSCSFILCLSLVTIFRVSLPKTQGFPDFKGWQSGKWTFH